MKRLLYIDHDFHNKTKSSQFLEELLKSAYEVEVCNFDPYDKDPESAFECLKNKEFDILVLFQVTPDLERLKKNVSFKHAVFFPMYDASGGLDDDFWEQYRSFNIINFSRSLHERLLGLGLSSYYIQYFPKPAESLKYGNPGHVFFWQRLTDLNIDLVERLLRKIRVERIHVHKVLDPYQTFSEPSLAIAGKIKYSVWFDTREEMLRVMESCALYIAPRLYEGIGMSFLEAMAMGRCVIAPDSPTMNEYIVHGKNGLLYNYHKPKPIKASRIEKIQRNAYEYMKEGYARWTRDKYKILDWLEAPLRQDDRRRIKKQKKYQNIKIYLLFGFLPLLVLREKAYKRYYDLFGFLRILKSRKKETEMIFYLLGIIPVWKSKLA